jgi:hypothetical protein
MTINWFTAPDAERRATQMPEGFQPKAHHRALATELGVDLDEAFAMFRDHHGSTGKRFKSWDLALNTWLRREKQFSGNRSSSRPRPTDSYMVFKAPAMPPCPFGECNGSGWWVDRATRSTVLCPCWKEQPLSASQRRAERSKRNILNGFAMNATANSKRH